MRWLLVLLVLSGCAAQTHLADDRNMATMPFDQLVKELSKP